jgi:hypothetical protein
MRVLVYPENRFETLGAKRWRISWEELADHAKNKQGEDIDFDFDLAHRYMCYGDESHARRAAKSIVDSGVPFFGAVTLTQQVVDWFVEGDRVAEWIDCGQSEEIA